MNIIRNCTLAGLIITVFSCSGVSKEDRELAAKIMSDNTLDTVYVRAAGLLKRDLQLVMVIPRSGSVI